MRLKALKPLTLQDLEYCDGVYNVGHLVVLDHPWVSKGAAEEILAIANAEKNAVIEYIFELRDKQTPEE
jgi:hypothetical protein